MVENKPYKKEPVTKFNPKEYHQWIDHYFRKHWENNHLILIFYEGERLVTSFIFRLNRDVELEFECRILLFQFVCMGSLERGLYKQKVDAICIKSQHKDIIRGL